MMFIRAIVLLFVFFFSCLVCHAQNPSAQFIPSQNAATPFNAANFPGSNFPATPPPGTGGGPTDAVINSPVTKIWSGSGELGLNGTEGNTQLFNFRIGGDLKRETSENIFTTNLVFGFTRQGGDITRNQAIWNARDEILLQGTPWSIFSQLALEYDKFRAFEYRLALHAGVSYLLYKDESTYFKTRLGAGASREFGRGIEGNWVPEGLVGADFEHKFGDRQRLFISADYFPDFTDISRYRIRTRLAYEFIIDPSNGLILRMGIQDRFDSKPGPSKRNDFEYFTTIGVKF